MTARDDSDDPRFPEQLRDLAVSAARLGGEMARRSFGQIQVVTLKADRSEVTEIDVAAERAIVAHIRDRRPGDAFIGEEGGQSDEATKRRSDGGVAADVSSADRMTDNGGNPQSAIRNPHPVVWIIDPIDGTRNYVRGVAPFVCSVAAMRAGWPVAGAVYDPLQDVMYSAAAGGGLRIDGGPALWANLEKSPPRDPGDTLFVGIPSSRRATTQPLVYHAVESHIVRNFGTAALHLALVATGVLDVVVMGNGKLWDIAAGVLLISEAGGTVTAPDGSPLFPLDLSRYADEEVPLVAGNPAAHARLMRESKQTD